ncbi:hypothetical protein B1H58_09785 [Pantoea alhagi]|uniref:Uncharacterized protein n=1 Tax=Pantoea alhagi TaxID=1891675 RepID=A0A1W6B5B8_9GAMM|nr:hypothetical protein B1H58_09785 [Pantoea alhagi]
MNAGLMGFRPRGSRDRDSRHRFQGAIQKKIFVWDQFADPAKRLQKKTWRLIAAIFRVKF